MDHQPDPGVMDRAMALDRVVFMSDTDFLAEAHRRQSEGLSLSGVIFARQTRLSIGALIGDLHLIAECATPDELANRVYYLPP